MANKNLVGTFVFRNEGDGCLTSKYFHGNQDYPFVEACKRQRSSKPKEDGFDGLYTTVWIQDDNIPQDSELRIRWNKKGNTYNLTWSDNKKIIFQGIGMIYDELLVGAYWD